MRKIMHYTVKYKINNTGQFNSRYIVLGQRIGLMILANGNFAIGNYYDAISIILCFHIDKFSGHFAGKAPIKYLGKSRDFLKKF